MKFYLQKKKRKCSEEKEANVDGKSNDTNVFLSKGKRKLEREDTLERKFAIKG